MVSQEIDRTHPHGGIGYTTAKGVVGHKERK
jgi:hypothetical protein